MKAININGEHVEVSNETFARIEKVARERGVAVADAVRSCLESVAEPSTTKQRNNNMGEQIYTIDEPNAVTIKITGAAFDNLKRITEIFNAWDENDFTPGELITEKFINDIQVFVNLDTRNPGKYQTTMPGALCDMYQSEPDVDALRAAFVDDGFAVQS